MLVLKLGLAFSLVDTYHAIPSFLHLSSVLHLVSPSFLIRGYLLPGLLTLLSVPSRSARSF